MTEQMTSLRNNQVVLGAGLEPACLSAYAPQTYVSAIPPPERLNLESEQNLPQTTRRGKPPFGGLVLIIAIDTRTEREHR